MRYSVAGALALLGAMAGPAFAQTASPPLGGSPLSTRDSNITAANTRGGTAPRLPNPGLAAEAPVADYLKAARDAVLQGKTGKAQESLEMAQTRALSRSVVVGQSSVPSDSPLVLRITAALQALGNGDRKGAVQIIDAITTP